MSSKNDMFGRFQNSRFKFYCVVVKFIYKNLKYDCDIVYFFRFENKQLHTL